MFHSELSLIPFVLQMLRMIGDEFYFHRRRTLPRWEWLGHPLDTLSVLLCWSVILLTKPAWVLSGNLVEVSPPVNASAGRDGDDRWSGTTRRDKTSGHIFLDWVRLSTGPPKS